jgi:hypothetical protein
MHEVCDRSFSTFCSHLVSPILSAAVKPCPDHSTSVIATSTSPEERTETLLEDAAQTRLGTTLRSISHMTSPVVFYNLSSASINSLLMLMTM